ncbi:MAG TPA: hypothetical protein VHN82_01535 [Methanoregula sp.]|nr:hypothetical protein [Methanoregula sp.]
MGNREPGCATGCCNEPGASAMTRGPPPLGAIRQAAKNAMSRGQVVNRDLFKESRADFVVFSGSLTIFVRIRRTSQHMLCPEDCAYKFKADVHFLRRIPLTPVTARELWLLTPWKTWEYFRVLDDRLIEVRADGAPILIERPGLPGIAVPGEIRQEEAHPPGSSSSENYP